MPEDRDGQHAGGSIVDTTRANMSEKQLEKEKKARENERRADEEHGAER